MGKLQSLVIILVFSLLLTAGLDYTGRNMHHALGGDKNLYTFLLPDMNDSLVVFCGHAYTEYQMENLYGRQMSALDRVLQVAPWALDDRVLLLLGSRLEVLWSFAAALLIELQGLLASLHP